MRSRLIIPILLVLFLLASCAPVARPEATAVSSRSWTHADLRLLDPLDGAKPGQEIIAAYARQSGTDVELRVDILHSNSAAEFDLYLAVDTRPGGQRETPAGVQAELDWEMWVGFPSGAPSTAVWASAGERARLTPRLYRDLDLDAAVVRLNWHDLGSVPARLRFQVFLCDPGTTRVVEYTGVFAFDAPAPAPAPLLVAFWNTLPAQTPAQTLRRWNGAHTGPAGHRHGLAQIVQAVEDTRVPVMLLDLKTPDSLAGLEQVNGLKQVQRLVARGLLALPDAGFGDPLAAETALKLSRLAGLRFGLAASALTYTPLNSETGRYRVIFGHDPCMTGPAFNAGARVIPLPGGDVSQPDTDGLSLDTRRQILSAALAGDASLTVLGGDVQHSLWADAEVAGKALGYIANHPWMRPLRGDELLTLPAQSQPQPGRQKVLCAAQSGSQGDESLRAVLRQAIGAIGDEAWREQGWLMYLRLTQPTADGQRARLQAGYLGQVGYLVEAGKWLRQPGEQSDCTRDVDWDGLPECVLASDRYFTILEADGARLALAVVRDEQGAQEWVGPSAQFALGLGPPETWQPERGQAGDPLVIPGGLADQPDAFAPYLPSSAARQITFTGPDGRQKIYRLAGNQIEIEYRGNPALTTRIPVLLGAASPRQPGWGMQFFNQLNSDLHSYRWWQADQTGAGVWTSARLIVHSPLDSFALMGAPEDPDREYPPGHFLPYPVVEVTIETSGPFTVTLGTQ